MGRTQEPLERLLLDVLPRAGKMMRDEIASVEPQQLTLQQYRVLSLVHGGVCFAGDISKNLGVSQAAMSKFMDSLQDMGWVKKKHCPEDGRKYLVSLTRDGEAVMEGFRESLSRRMVGRLSRLSPRERDGLERGLRVLSQIVESEEGDES